MYINYRDHGGENPSASTRSTNPTSVCKSLSNGSSFHSNSSIASTLSINNTTTTTPNNNTNSSSPETTTTNSVTVMKMMPLSGAPPKPVRSAAGSSTTRNATNSSSSEISPSKVAPLKNDAIIIDRKDLVDSSRFKSLEDSFQSMVSDYIRLKV